MKKPCSCNDKCSHVPCKTSLVKHHSNCIPISSQCDGNTHFIFGTLLKKNTLLWSISNDCPDCTLQFTVMYSDGKAPYSDSIPGGSSLVNVVDDVQSIEFKCVSNNSADFCRGRFDYELTYTVEI